MNRPTSIPEDFLHYVWKHLLFDLPALKTTAGIPVWILNPGKYNRDQGPDFSEARIRVGEMEWNGQVEIHLESRQWYQHGHHLDPGYNHTVLHVVQSSDGQPIRREDGSLIPEVEIGPLMGKQVWPGYQGASWQDEGLACAEFLEEVPGEVKHRALKQAMLSRMEDRVTLLKIRLDQLHGDWQQVLWEEILASMGGPVNRDVFRWIGRSLPGKVWYRYRHDRRVAESLLLGASGLLVERDTTEGEDWHMELWSSWQHLRDKHRLLEEKLPLKYSRMRPSGFPDLRLVQVAALLSQWDDWLELLQPAGWQLLREQEFRVSEYWHTHYRLGRPARTHRTGALSDGMKSLLLANVLIPLAQLYREAHGLEAGEEWLKGAFSWIGPESNRITRQMKGYGFEASEGWEAQGIIHLYRSFCQKKRCLSCSIGQRILGKDQAAEEPELVYG